MSSTATKGSTDMLIMSDIGHEHEVHLFKC